MVWLPDWKWNEIQAAKGKGGKSGGDWSKGGSGGWGKGGKDSGKGGSDGWDKGSSWKGGGGSSSWKGGGGKSWIPPWQPQFMKDKGAGKSGKGEKGGKGGGKGKHRQMNPKHMVWVGNLASGVTFKELFELAKQGGTPKWCEVWSKKQTGAIEYNSEEEVANALILLSGSMLGGSTITCDVWEKQEKPQEQ
eukprot:CAMPEP_0204575110 /NCGR_PEP_ID=MMETSP0661-20131031/40992_1 /ASSEMBLY_ACC=CAM_ASM_000606 /TAXON_ID=109239 /ORGANISM="Alexandrium margalefi, Strain AMGDE01CS-322" /LENGTH=190 /DNA_ID=CAMNT_0051583693 /DNA_START=62 /DNA_END=634 /DNA_ORIENTATION=-